MKLHAFQLGRIKGLCLAELKAVLGKDNFVDTCFGMALFNTTVEDAQELQDSLGGSIKIAEIISETSAKDLQDNLENLIRDHFKDPSGKTPFAISTFNERRSKDIDIKSLLIFSKKVLKSLGLNSRFVNKGRENPRPSTIYKARVLRKGVDINIIKHKDLYLLGKTLSIQNIDAYSTRDYHKPMRDMKVGMTPPKLAQIMINLAGRNTKTIYDPFCGTGTFLMESLLMGKKAIGSDIEERMIEYSQKNLEWFHHKFDCSNDFKLFKRDARFVTKSQLPDKIDAVVTEGYLGKVFSIQPSKEEKEIELRELANLHLNWLTALHPLLPKQAKIVMCLTNYKNGNRIEDFPKFEEIAQTAGYRIVDSFLYDRENQIVARAIKVLEKIY
jgi:tRNA G10  N-methylase Trm11